MVENYCTTPSGLVKNEDRNVKDDNYSTHHKKTGKNFNGITRIECGNCKEPTYLEHKEPNVFRDETMAATILSATAAADMHDVLHGF